MRASATIILGTALGLVAAVAQTRAADLVFDASGSGDLAWAEPDGSRFHVAIPGDALPARAILRTSPAGLCDLKLGDGTLEISPESQLLLDAERRTFDLARGAVVVHSSAQWSVRPDRHVPAGQVTLVELRDGQVELTPFAQAEDRLAWRAKHRGEAGRRGSQGLGELVIADPNVGGEVRLNLARFHVNVVLNPPVALVQIDQAFYNPYDAQREGTFLFDLPEGAAVSRFAMYTSPEVLVEGELIERDRANQIYSQIVYRRRDPAILEQIGRNVFKMRVFPIPAKDIKRVLLDYTIPLREEAGGWHTFRLPMWSDLAPIDDFRLQGTLLGPTVADSVRMVSHPQIVARPGKDNRFTFTHETAKFQTDADFVLRFRQQSPQDVTLRWYRTPMLDEKTPAATYYLATIRPEALPAQHDEAPPADVLILADTSGRQARRPWLRQAVRTVARNLRPQDSVRLACVDVEFRELTREWQTVGGEGIESALKDFDQELFLGRSNFEGTFREAWAMLGATDPQRRQVLLYIGDGQLPPDGKFAPEDMKLFTDQLSRTAVTFAAIQIGDDLAARDLLHSLCEPTGGRLFAAADVSGGLREVFAWSQEGAPTVIPVSKVTLTGVETGDLYSPKSWTPGHAIHILGRSRQPVARSSRLELIVGAKEITYDWSPGEAAPQDAFVGRLWAKDELDTLFQELTQFTGHAGETWMAAKRAEIVAVSQEWTLISPLTAFLVLETEADYSRWGLTRRERHRYWRPEGTVVARPLSPEFRDTPAQIVRKIDMQRIERRLEAARKALRDGRTRVAFDIMELLRPYASQNAEIAKLADETSQTLRREVSLRKLGRQRGLFDPEAADSQLPPADAMPLYSAGVIPLSPQSLDPTERWRIKQVSPKFNELALPEFADWLRKETGLNVVLDVKTLEDEGFDRHKIKISMEGIQSMSLGKLVDEVLSRHSLSLSADDEVLVLSTAASGGDRLTTRLYPVQDLIQIAQPTSAALAAPELDLELAAQDRLRRKLDRRISVNFEKNSVRDVLAFLGRELDDNVIIDPIAFDEGMTPRDRNRGWDAFVGNRRVSGEDAWKLKSEVTLMLNDVPIRTVLKRVLEPHDLGFEIDREALVISSQSELGNRLTTRVHSLYGLLTEWPQEVRDRWQQSGRSFGVGGAVGPSGGLGGFGGIGGFFGGGTFPVQGAGFAGSPPAPNIESGNMAVSDVSDDREDAHTDSDPGVEDALDELQISSRWSGAGVGGFSRGPLPGAGTGADFTPWIDLITSTVAPETWDGVGGPASVREYNDALAIVFRQTGAEHDEIADLIRQLKKMPLPTNSGLRQAELQKPRGPLDWDFGALIDILMNTVEPETWDNVGGAGSVREYQDRLTLSIRQTDAVHRDIRHVLAQLRRAQWAARLKLPATDELLSGWRFVGMPQITSLPNGERLAAYPQPDAEELQLLQVRREPKPGKQVWERKTADGRAERTAVTWDGKRWQVVIDGRRVRIEGDDAAVEHVGLSLVEIGTWGEPLRQILDARLPWLAYRSNAEIARLFKVEQVEADDSKVTLRLRPAGAADETHIVATFPRETGLAKSWEMWAEGKLLAKLRFTEFANSEQRTFPKSVVWEDAAGKELARWLLWKIDRMGDVPPLEESWSGLVLDHRRADAMTPARRAFEALRSDDLLQVRRTLDELVQAQPDQPLLRFLRAGLYERDPRPELFGTMLDDLKAVVAGPADDLAKFVASGWFTRLGAADLYAVLSSQPAEKRSAENWDRLADAARKLVKLPEAVEHAQKAIEKSPTLERRIRLIELLGLAGRKDEAVDEAIEAVIDRGRTTGGVQSSEDIALVAEALYAAQAGQAKEGEPTEWSKLFAQALADKNVSGERRARILRRQADTEFGLARWLSILAARELMPVAAKERQAWLEQMLGEFSQPRDAEAIEQLLPNVKDPAVRTPLRLRQAQLLPERPERAGEILWSLHQAGQLARSQQAWACGVWIAARRGDRVTAVIEPRLRAGEMLAQELLQPLAQAYDLIGRDRDARRARTSQADAPKNWSATRSAPPQGAGFF